MCMCVCVSETPQKMLSHGQLSIFYSTSFFYIHFFCYIILNNIKIISYKCKKKTRRKKSQKMGRGMATNVHNELRSGQAGRLLGCWAMGGRQWAGQSKSVSTPRFTRDTFFISFFFHFKAKHFSVDIANPFFFVFLQRLHNDMWAAAFF